MLEGGRELMLSIEKRINFTIEDLAPTSKAYDYFRSFFIDVTDNPSETSASSSSSSSSPCRSGMCTLLDC